MSLVNIDCLYKILVINSLNRYSVFLAEYVAKLAKIFGSAKPMSVKNLLTDN